MENQIHQHFSQSSSPYSNFTSSQDSSFEEDKLLSNKENEEPQIVKEKKGGQMMEFFFEKPVAFQHSQYGSVTVFRQQLQEIDSFETLDCLLSQSPDNYYLFFKDQVRSWWAFMKELIVKNETNPELIFKNIFNLFEYAFNSLSCASELKQEGLFVFNRFEASQLLNDTQLIKALQYLTFELPIQEHFQDVIKCISMLVQLINNFNGKIKTSISYRLQDRKFNVLQKLLDNFQEVLVLKGPVKNFNHFQFSNVLELYLSFQKDKYFNLQFYEDLIIELICDLRKNWDLAKVVRPAMTYMRVMKELCKELFFTVAEIDVMRLFIFARKVIRQDVHRFILDFYLGFENGEIKLKRDLENYFYYYAQGTLLMISKWSLQDKELLELLCQHPKYLQILKVCLFDPTGYYRPTQVYFKREAMQLYSEISRLAIFNEEILKQLQVEGFIDLTMLSLQDWRLQYQNIGTLREALQNLHKAQSVNQILKNNLVAKPA